MPSPVVCRPSVVTFSTSPPDSCRIELKLGGEELWLHGDPESISTSVGRHGGHLEILQTLSPKL